MHYLSTGIRAHRETHPLKPKLNKMMARKYADARDKPNTLEAIFQMAEQCSKRMLEADSFDHSNTFRVPSTINEISDAEINEVSRAIGTMPDMMTTKLGKIYTEKPILQR